MAMSIRFLILMIFIHKSVNGDEDCGFCSGKCVNGECNCGSGNYWDGLFCMPCSTCDPNAHVTVPCTATSDLSCECNSGFYNTESSYCFACSCQDPNAQEISLCNNGDQYNTCQCNSGYFNYHASPNTSYCSSCLTCDQNAKVISPCNLVHDVTCECNAGYYAYSGQFFCAPCSTCDENAHMVEPCDPRKSSDTTVCQCNSGYVGDGLYDCELCSACIGNTHVSHQCGPLNDTVCQCNSGYYKTDKFDLYCLEKCSSCAPNAHVVKECDSESDITCQCNSGFYNAPSSYTPGSSCLNCSNCDANAHKNGSCDGTGTENTVSCWCASGYYGNGETCSPIVSSPVWIPYAAYAFSAAVIVATLVSLRLGFYHWFSKFSCEAEFRTASTIKKRVSVLALCLVAAMCYPIYEAVMFITNTYQATCGMSQDSLPNYDTEVLLSEISAASLSSTLLSASFVVYSRNPDAANSNSCWGRVSNFIRPIVGTLAYYCTVLLYLLGGFAFLRTGLVCWGGLNTLLVQEVAFGLLGLGGILPDVYSVYLRCTVARRAQLRIAPKKKATGILSKMYQSGKALASSEVLLLLRSAVLLAVTVASVAELSATNFSTALESCQAGWKQIYDSRGMTDGEVISTGVTTFTCSSPNVGADCRQLLVSEVSVGSKPQCLVGGSNFSSRRFLTVVNLSAATPPAGQKVLLYRSETYPVPDLEYAGLADSVTSQLSNTELYSGSDSDVLPSYDLSACTLVRTNISLWLSTSNSLNSFVGWWDPRYDNLCPDNPRCNALAGTGIGVSYSRLGSAASSSIQLSQWYYLEAYVSCDNLISMSPVQTVYLTASNILFNMLPIFCSVMVMWRTRWQRAAGGTDGADDKGSNDDTGTDAELWHVSGGRPDLEPAGKLSAYATLEMAGVPGFEGGLALKAESPTLRSLFPSPFLFRCPSTTFLSPQ